VLLYAARCQMSLDRLDKDSGHNAVSISIHQRSSDLNSKHTAQIGQLVSVTEGEAILDDRMVHQSEERHGAQLVITELTEHARQTLLGERVLRVRGHAETMTISEFGSAMMQYLY
jgi:hypothetical protein